MVGFFDMTSHLYIKYTSQLHSLDLTLFITYSIFIVGRILHVDKIKTKLVIDATLT
jgi:hypothetical protein